MDNLEEFDWDSIEPTPYVKVCNGDWAPACMVDFDNVEEDFWGNDMVTFVCPVCGEEHRSMVVVK